MLWKYPVRKFCLVSINICLIMSSIIYDFINEPQSTGPTRDKFTGKDKPKPILPYRLTGQWTSGKNVVLKTSMFLSTK